MRLHILSHEKGKTAFWTLAFATSIMMGIYIYSLNMAVFDVARRGTVENNASTLRNSIADLESKYITLKKGISMDLAYSLGYKEIENTTIIPKKSVSIVGGLSSTE